MITEPQKQKMLESVNSFCIGILCENCPLWKKDIESNCLRNDLFDKVENIETIPICPHCKQEWKQ